MVYLIVAVVVFALVFMGWKLTSRDAYESAEYTVLQSEGSFELREYPDLMMATTEMGSRIESGDGSFGRLFQYISGGNEDKQKVAMTTPVFIEPKADQQSGQMGFVIPKDVADSTIPEPTSEQVQLTKRPGGKFAVIRFSGRVDSGIQKEQQAKLETWIEKEQMEAVGEPESASYDPPWTPGPLRRNEILIRIGS